jgi:hypothetical protein
MNEPLQGFEAAGIKAAAVHAGENGRYKSKGACPQGVQAPGCLPKLAKSADSWIRAPVSAQEMPMAGTKGFLDAWNCQIFQR